MTKPTTAVSPATPAHDTVEFRITNAAADKARKLLELQNALRDGALGNALPEKYAPGRFVLADGTIVERRQAQQPAEGMRALIKRCVPRRPLK
jgi:hypothetical protein